MKGRLLTGKGKAVLNVGKWVRAALEPYDGLRRSSYSWA